MDWLLSALIITVIHLMGKKDERWWIVGILASLLWIYYIIFMLNPPQYGLLISTGYCLLLSIQGSIVWCRKNNRNCIFKKK